MRKALKAGPDSVVREVLESKLLGRGGAAFPTGRKWDPANRSYYLVCNADESEPGTFKDRVLMEGDPFALVEAMTVAAFAIAVAGRGFNARISTEFAVPLPDSACVYCGNCIGACPTGALMFRSEYEMRQNGTWDESKQTITGTICPYCGVGCTLALHVQDNRIVKVTSPLDNEVTRGHLCIKGRFGWQFVQLIDKE